MPYARALSTELIAICDLDASLQVLHPAPSPPRRGRCRCCRTRAPQLLEAELFSHLQSFTTRRIAAYCRPRASRTSRCSSSRTPSSRRLGTSAISCSAAPMCSNASSRRPRSQNISHEASLPRPRGPCPPRAARLDRLRQQADRTADLDAVEHAPEADEQLGRPAARLPARASRRGGVVAASAAEYALSA